MSRSPPLTTARGRLALPLVLLVPGTAAVALAWIALAAANGSPASWMALVAAADAAWLLRLGGMSGGPRRAAWAVGATAVAIVVAQWGIAATGIGRLIGLSPLESAFKLGTGLAWTVAGLLNGPVDVALLVAALLLAAVAGR